MFQLVALHYRSHTNWMTRHCRLPRTHLARTSMLLSSTSRTSSARPPRSSSTPCMIPTAKALTLSVVTPSASGREPRLLSLTACGLTSLTMMLLLRWSSLVRGTPGTACSSHDWSDIQQQFSCINKFYWPLFFFLFCSGMLMLSWLCPREPCSPCVAWTLLLTVISSVLQCTLVSWVMASLLVATTTCGLDGAWRFVFLSKSYKSLPWIYYMICLFSLHSWTFHSQNN